MGRYELSPAKPWDIDFIAEMGAGFWKLAHPGLQWRTQSELETLLRSLEQTLEACFHLVLDVHNNKKVKVEATAPRRIIQWNNSLGHEAKLLKSERMKYWQLNRNGGEKMLEKIGLKARPKRHP